MRLADGDELAGWAVSFGTYDTMLKADMALRGRVLSPIGIWHTQSHAGVVTLAGQSRLCCHDVEHSARTIAWPCAQPIGPKVRIVM